MGREGEVDDGWSATSGEEWLQAKSNEDMDYRSDLRRKNVLDSTRNCSGHTGL